MNERNYAEQWFGKKYKDLTEDELREYRKRWWNENKEKAQLKQQLEEKEKEIETIKKLGYK